MSAQAVQFCLNMIIYTVWVLFFDRVLERRFRSLLSPVCAAVLIIGMGILSSLLPGESVFRTVSPIISSLLAVFLFYRGKFLYSLLSALSPIVVVSLCELMAVAIIPEVRQMRFDSSVAADTSVLLICILYIVLEVTLLWIESLLMKKTVSKLSAKEFVLYILFPVSQAFALTVITYLYISSDDGGASWLTLITCVLFALADTAMFRAMRSSVEKAELKARAELMENQLELQEKHYSALTEQYETMRKVRHDIKQHMNTIQLLLGEGRTAEAEEYAAELNRSERRDSNVGMCKNPVVDAFICDKLREISAMGLKADCVLNLPDETAISNTDLICAYGNLIDNAIEHCRGHEGAEIRISTDVTRGFLVICTANPVFEAVEKQRRIPELERGIGFKSLESVAEKYNGSFTHSTESGIFTAKLALKV